MENPANYAFWSEEEKELWEKLAPLVIAALLAGASGGAELLQPEVAALINWDIFDDAAQRYLFDYRMSVLASINTTTMQRVLAAIATFDFSKGTPQQLSKLVSDILKNDARIEAIAITEVTRLFAKGSILIWAASGIIPEIEWVTSLDERVCPICAPLHGRKIKIWEEFLPGVPSPPVHPRCRCWVKPS